MTRQVLNSGLSLTEGVLDKGNLTDLLAVINRSDANFVELYEPSRTWVPSDVTGATNMASELEAFAAANPGYTITVPDSATILLKNAFKLVTTGDILIDFGNATILYDNNTSSDAAIYCDNTGNAGAEKSVASIASATVNNDATVTQITLSETASASRFDWIAFYSADANPAKAGGVLGEIVQMLSDEDTLVLTCTRKLNRFEQYATSMKVRKLDASRKVHIRGGTFQANGDTQDHGITSRCDAITIQGFVDPIVEDVTFYKPWSICVRFRACAAPRWKNLTVKDVGNLATYNGFIYGVMLYGMNDSADGRDIVVRNGRHSAFTTDGNSSGSTSWWQKGIPTNFVVDGVHGYNCHASIVDTHEEGDGGHISNVHGYHTYQDEDISPDFSGVVVQLRCARTRLSNVHCYGGTNGIKVAAVEHGFEDQVHIDNVHIERTTQGSLTDNDIGINVADQTALTNKRHVHLRNVSFDDVGKCIFLGDTAKMTVSGIEAQRFDTFCDNNEGSIFIAKGDVSLDFSNNPRTAAYLCHIVRSTVEKGGATVIYLRKPVLIKGDGNNEPTNFFEEQDTTADKIVYAPGITEYNPSAVTATALYEAGATTFVRADIADTSAAPFALSFNARADSSTSLTNMAAAAQFFPQDSKRAIRKVDLTHYRQARLVINVATGATTIGKLVAKYKATLTYASDAATDFLDLGTAEISASVVTAGVIASAWVNLAALAKADVFVAVTQIDGTGAATPGIGAVDIEFR